MHKPTFFKGFTTNIILLGFISLFTDLSSEMVFPLIPLYLISLGAGATIIGLVEGAAETTASLLKIFSGYWSDKLQQRKPFVLAGYSLSTITKPLFALATTWPLILLFRILERIGKGIRTAPRDAIIAESCDHKIRGKGYGFHRAMDGTGAILGAITAIILFPLVGFTSIFLYAFIPGIIAVLIILFIKEKKHEPDNTRTCQQLTLRISLHNLPKNLRLFILVSTIFTLGNFGYAFIMIRTQQEYGTTQTILFYLIFLIFNTLLSIPAGILSDKIGRKPVIFIGYSLFATICFSLLFLTSYVGFFIIYIVYGIFTAMIEGVHRAFVVDLSPPYLKGTALGTYHASVGIIALPGGIIAGLLWDILSPNTTFIYGLILSISAIALLIFVKKTSKEFALII